MIGTCINNNIFAKIKLTWKKYVTFHIKSDTIINLEN